MNGRAKDPNTRNITVTNPKIIEMLNEYKLLASQKLGIEVTTTQALTLLLKKALDK